MQYQEERFFDVVSEIVPLLHEHWEEIALNRDTIALDPDWDAYRHMDAVGLMKITTARDEGKLVGYVIYFLVPNMHYKGWMVADGDIFWMHPDYRKGTTGIRLLKAAEDIVKRAGARVIVNKTKLHKDLGRLFERMGYAPIERVYSKVVG